MLLLNNGRADSEVLGSACESAREIFEATFFRECRDLILYIVADLLPCVPLEVPRKQQAEKWPA